MRQDLYEKIKANDPGGTAQAASDALALVIDKTEKSIDDRMINERSVFAIIGMATGEAFMAAIEADANIPTRVKDWFKPSEQGVDVLDVSVASIFSSMVGASVITQAEADLLTDYGYESSPAYPGISPLMVQNARDQVIAGV